MDIMGLEKLRLVQGQPFSVPFLPPSEQLERTHEMLKKWVGRRSFDMAPCRDALDRLAPLEHGCTGYLVLPNPWKLTIAAEESPNDWGKLFSHGIARALRVMRSEFSTRVTTPFTAADNFFQAVMGQATGDSLREVAFLVGRYRPSLTMGPFYEQLHDQSDPSSDYLCFQAQCGARHLGKRIEPLFLLSKDPINPAIRREIALDLYAMVWLAATHADAWQGLEPFQVICPGSVMRWMDPFDHPLYVGCAPTICTVNGPSIVFDNLSDDTNLFPRVAALTGLLPKA